MSPKEIDCCRLCSSHLNLISMFSGKSRTIRDFLRKMIEETVNIRIERFDSVPSVCFNCSIDVSNYYSFKLQCLQNERDLMVIQSPVKVKRLKLQSLDLKEVERPDLKATETVLNWLTSKRNGIMTLSETSLNKNIETIQEHCDVETQSNVLETLSKESQTIAPKLVVSKIQYEEFNIVCKKATNLRSTHTRTSTEKNSSECSSCSIKLNGNGLSKKEAKSRYIQTPTNFCCNNSACTSVTDDSITLDYIKDLKDSNCQTDPLNICFKSNDKKLSQHLFQEIFVPKVCTQETSAQTDVINQIDKHTQCDILRLNGFQNGLLQTKAGETRSSCKITDPLTFNEAMLDGLDNIFVSKMSQTELSAFDHFSFSDSYFSNKDSYLLSHSSNSFSNDLDTKLDIRISFPEKLKEEKISPSEILISTQQSPENSCLSPQYSSLLKVNSSKSDRVKICKFCDMTLYNKQEARIHNKTHMQCSICKRKFRSLRAAQVHINDCKVKQISFSPFVELIKVDQAPDLKETYFRALKRLQ